MQNIVIEGMFPDQQYKPIEGEPQDEGKNVKRYIYQKIKSKPVYLIYHETLRCPPPQTKESIIAEINAFQKCRQQYEQGIFLPDRVYIFQSEGNLNIFLRVWPHKSKTLDSAIKAKRQGDNALQKMQWLADAVHKLHKNGHCHGRIKLSTIICRKEGRVKLDIPDYSQIKKWRQVMQVPQNQDKVGLHSTSDLFSLGFVFLQMMIGQVLPQNMPLSSILDRLPLVQDQVIRKLIKLMLKQLINILEIARILDNPIDKDNIAFLNSKEDESSKYQVFKFVFSRQTQPQKVNKATNEKINIIKHHSSNHGPIQFIFLDDDNLLVRFASTNSIEVLADISHDFQQNKKNFPWFNRQNLQQMIKDEKSKVDISVEGVLLFFCLIDSLPKAEQPKEIIKETKQSLRNTVDVSLANIQNTHCRMANSKNTCLIAGKTAKKGFIITQNTVLTILSKKQSIKIANFDITGNKQTLKMSIKQCTGILDKQSNPLNYTLLFVNFQNLSVQFPYYLKLIKDYSQKIVMQKFSQQKNATLKYQLGDNILVPGQITFRQTSFQIITNRIDRNSILPGQPLRILNSSNGSAVIGIHVKDGRGFLITADFIFLFYQLLSLWRNEVSLIKDPVPFVWIQCRNFDIQQGDIININDNSIDHFLKVNSITDREKANAYLNKLEDRRQNFITLGFCNYIIAKNYSLGNGQMVSRFKKAIEYFKSIYSQKGILFAVIYQKMGDLLMVPLRSRRHDPETIEGITKLNIRGLQYLQECHVNPYLCLSLYLNIIQLSRDPLVLLKMLAGAYQISKDIYFHSTKLNLLYQFLEFKKYLPIDQVKKIQTDIDLILAQNPNLSFLPQYFNTIMKQIKRNINQKQFNLVTSQFYKLFLQFGKIILEKIELEDQVVSLWKTAYVQYMISCNDIAQLVEFEYFSKKYVEYCHSHAVNSFRQKEKSILRSNKKLVNA